MNIRVLSEADANDYRLLRLRGLKEEPGSFGASYEESLEMSLSEAARNIKSSSDAFVLGAFAPHLVGMVGFYRRGGMKLRHKGIVWGTYVEPESRGKGIGKSLMQALIDRVTTMDELDSIMLSVVTTNKEAKHLYLSLGFTSYGLERQALKVGSEFLDEDLLCLELDKK